MKKTSLSLIAASILLSTAPCAARDFVGKDGKCSSVSINLKARGDISTENTDFAFKCNYLRMSITTDFAENFSFTFRQRFNKAITAENPLAATDYLYLRWRKNGWEITAGKYYVACGGFEYLATSYDIYIRPVFFNGLGGMYNYVAEGSRIWEKEKLTLQFGNSLYSINPSNLLGYSLLLRGQQGVWEHAYSVNAFEREKGLYNFYVCLGNRFHIGRIGFDVGLVHRTDVHNPALFKDFSAVAKFKVHATEWMDVLGKATWDYKETGIADPMLPDGTNTWQAGGGFEFFPARNFRGFRLHCVYFNQNGRLNCVLAGLSVNLSLL